ncbi:hypothetical protein MADA3029_1160003 [Vibrio nigripulchritudo MADA3029]|uniref:hypothetical protein n=1 Tax=Vibrio nigripulchritudo TaxID=28173 RepID=UPI0003B20226|nr:hypothetical protein [Vibrio nigripulchritudo]CCN47674.1 hypothetical protein VIBNIMADA3020_430003 [Vibrio nigripulchritudo MADA3020]CCN54514.1 hypothetical protein VIBNIMADA3021_560001 [Vibrio nigripulchritudo MADA3021]CCN57675.1 hypothetical protein MADA3029_1160003 [Vibrio nigripulchritudo MADA3029]
MKKCVVEYDVNFESDIHLSFTFDNYSIDTVEGINEYGKSCTLLRVAVIHEVKCHEALVDLPIFTRASYLSALGIMSFLVDEPLDVFGPSTRQQVVDKDWKQSLSSSFIKEGKDCTLLLTEFLDKLALLEKYEKEFIFSLLDRWRKARFLEKETEESFLYNDEATLAYFHVLELLGDLSSKQILKDSKALIDTFCGKYNEEILSLSGAALESETVAKAKLIASVLDKDISVYAKISYLLKGYGLFEERTSYWVKNLIEARNAVAHGRRVFYDKAVFPVQPFFPLASNQLYPVEYLRFFSAKIIASHIGLSLYNDEWESIHQHLNYGESATKAILSSETFESIGQLTDLESSVAFGGLNDLILLKKVKVAACTNYYQFYLEDASMNVDFMLSNVCAFIVLLEASKDADLTTRIIEVFKSMKASDETSHVKFRDLIYYLDFHGFKVSKLESLVSDKHLR